MSFDPSKPANNAPLSSSEMRSQLTSLNTDIQTRVTQSELISASNNAAASAIASTLPQTSSNSNAVNPLNMTADGSYNPTQFQDMANKIDELINTLRR